MRALLKAVSLVGLSSGVLVHAPAGCTHSCTAMGCFSAVELRFDPPIGEAGQYSFMLEADGERSQCELDFDGSASFPRSEGCSSLVVEGTRFRNASTAPGEPFAIIGFDLPPAEAVAVQVSRDGVFWAEHRFEPEWKGIEINGPGCGECPTAREAIELP